MTLWRCWRLWRSGAAGSFGTLALLEVLVGFRSAGRRMQAPGVIPHCGGRCWFKFLVVSELSGWLVLNFGAGLVVAGSFVVSHTAGSRRCLLP